MNQFASLWKGGLGVDAWDWLDRHGWQVHTHDVLALAISYGRPAPTHSGGGCLIAVRH